jgi:hypothetical protein
MDKLGDLKKSSADLTAALNALNAEIEAANDDMRSLDEAHVQHLGAIKNQLQSLDEELRKIIAADPGAAGSGMGPGSGAAGSGAAGSGGPSVYATRAQGPGSGAARLGDETSSDEEDMPVWARNNPRRLQRSGPHVKAEDVDTDDVDTDDGPAMMLPRSRGAAGGVHNVADEVDRINRNLPPRPHHATSSKEDELLNAGLSGSRSGPSPFARSVPRGNRGGGRRTRRRQRGGYIAVKKTRSKSSSSSGRRKTRRSSSSRSKSTRRRRHRSSSSSSRR